MTCPERSKGFGRVVSLMTMAVASLTLAACGGERAQTSPRLVQARISERWSTARTVARLPTIDSAGYASEAGPGVLVGAEVATAADGFSCHHVAPPGGVLVAGNSTGRFMPFRPLGEDLEAGPVAMPGGAAIVTGSTTSIDGECNAVGNLSLVDFSPSGRPVRSVQIAGSGTRSNVQLATDPQGDTAVAWIELHRSSTYRLRVAVHSTTGTLREPLTVAQAQGTAPAHPGISDDAIAYEPRGGLLIAYDQEGAVYVRVVTSGGTLGPAQRVGPSFAFGDSSLSLGVDRFGGGAIAWETEPGGEDARGRSRIYTAVRASAGDPFQPAVLMGSGEGGSVTEGFPSLAVSSSGAVVLEYAVNQQLDSRVYAANGNVAHGFGQARQLASKGTAGSAAISAAGARLFTWTQDGQVMAEYAARNVARFTRPELVATDQVEAMPSGQFIENRQPAVAWYATPQKGESTIRLAVHDSS
jgi:hypothetical protein